MAQMNHSEAKQLQAAEKYLLGELSATQRDEYEEHCFDCADCALDLKAMAAFADNAREVLRQETANSMVRVPVPVRAGWFSWFRPIVAAPVFAALLLVILYQNTVTIPRVKEEAVLPAGQVIAATVSLQTANTRGGEELKVQVPANEAFALKFDFTPAQKFESYVGKLQDQSGRRLLQVTIPGSSMNREVQLVVPAGLVKAGKHSLVFTGLPGSSGQVAGGEVLRLGFTVEFLP
jgi:hypothetical protein